MLTKNKSLSENPAIIKTMGSGKVRRGWSLFRNSTRNNFSVLECDDGSLEWRFGSKPGGELHRVDGPAMIRADGTEEWWVRGNRINKEDSKENGHPLEAEASTLEKVTF